MARSSTSGQGRPKGTPNKATADVRARIETHADPVGFLIDVAAGKPLKAAIPGAGDLGQRETVDIYPTLDQRMHAHGLLVKKLVPDAKSRTVALPLPSTATAAGVDAAFAAILAAQADGRLAMDEALTAATLLDLRRRALETLDHETRLAALEKQAGAKP